MPNWERIGDNRNTANVPRWVIDAFGAMPGNHGTLLIDYPVPGGSVRFRGSRRLLILGGSVECGIDSQGSSRSRPSREPSRSRLTRQPPTSTAKPRPSLVNHRQPSLASA